MTDAQRRAQAKYRASEKGKATHRKAQSKYQKSTLGKSTRMLNRLNKGVTNNGNA